jgi:hypothetical protein
VTNDRVTGSGGSAPGVAGPVAEAGSAGAARRFAIALDRAACTLVARFRVSNRVEQQPLPGKIRVRKNTFIRQDGRPVVDL